MKEGLKEGGRKTPNAGMGAGKVRNIECESVSVYTCMICVCARMYFCLLVYAPEALATVVNPTGMHGRQMAVVKRIETLCLLTFF
jgi:hypothetical protein